MCRRYSFQLDGHKGCTIHIDEQPVEINFEPRYNVAPRQKMPVIVATPGGPSVRIMQWGLIPSWTEDEKNTLRPASARSETVHEKPMFQQLLQTQRCLIPADGFYEWETTPNGELPWRFVMKDERPFLLAGLWDRWKRPPTAEFPEGETVESFLVLSTAANPLVSRVHNRMPVILPPERYKLWLVLDDAEMLQGCCEPFPAEAMDCYRVQLLVNSEKNDTVVCTRRLEDPSRVPPVKVGRKAKAGKPDGGSKAGGLRLLGDDGPKK